MEVKEFKDWRKEKGISARFVAHKLNMSPQSLYNKEKGKTEFSFKEGITYCNILHIIPEQVIS